MFAVFLVLISVLFMTDNKEFFDQVTIDKGPKVSTVSPEPYMEDRRSTGLIYSGIYNSKSNINNLNQFIQAEKITKDLNPDGGSIQKLYTRDTNLVTFCEDKIFKILANKDALYNADGNVNITSTKSVLGQAVPFQGELVYLKIQNHLHRNHIEFILQIETEARY